MTALLYVLAHAAAALLGLPVLWLREVRRWSLAARAAAAFAAGAVVLAVESTLATGLGLRWTPLLVLAPPLLLAAFLAVRGRSRTDRSRPLRPGRAAAAFGLAAGAVGGGHLAFSLATSRATSTDFLLFWGVKAVYFARDRAIWPTLLTHPRFQHGQPFYPPLVPVLDAWGVIAAGDMPWNSAPLVTLLWWLAASILVLEISRSRLDDRDAVILAAFWSAALAASFAASLSGANAEAPLVLYVTAAGLLLLTEARGPAASSRALAGVFLAGAVLTKVEGSVASALLVAGTLARDAASGRARAGVRSAAALAAPPLCAGLLWWTFLVRFGIAGDYRRGLPGRLNWSGLSELVGALVRHLHAGAWWAAWILPLVWIAAFASRRSFRAALPGVFAVAGLLAFLVFLYLHETSEMTMHIGWEVPRLSQPALSLLIGLAGVCFRPAAESPG